MASRPALLASVGALALVLGLAGCSSDAPAPAETTPSATESKAPKPTESTPEETETAAAPSNGETAAPGTEVSVGDTVAIDWSPTTGGTTQPVDVTVTSIVPGSIDDFAVVGADFQAKLEGFTPYYITVELTKTDLAAAPLANSSFYGSMSALDVDGQRMAPVSIIGDFEPCDTRSLEASVDEGAVQTFCYIMAVAEASELGAAAYKPSSGEFYDDPILWKTK